MLKPFLTFLMTLAVVLPVWAEDVPPPVDPSARHYLSIPENGLAAFMRRPPMAIPMVSHHRGGPMPGFPENSLEAMDNALAYGYGLMEVDVAQLKDGTLILMHDDTLGRTTTGQGALRQVTWNQVKDLNLKDENGAITGFKVPRLEDVLRWAVGKTILTLDIKRGVDFARVAAMVRETGAQDYAAGISYTMEQAVAFNRLAPRMPLSIGLYSPADVEALDKTDIPDELVIAWTGTSLLNNDFYQSLHERGWRTIVGTLGRRDSSIDARIRDGRGDLSYADIVALGADIVATDRFWAAQREIGNPNLFIFTQLKLAN